MLLQRSDVNDSRAGTFDPDLLIICAGVLVVQPELRLALPLLIGVTALMARLTLIALYFGERATRSLDAVRHSFCGPPVAPVVSFQSAATLQ